MSRKTILIILAIIIVLLGVWVVVESHKTSSTGGASSSKSILGSLFPFGSSTALPNTTATGTSTQNETGGTTATSTPAASTERLVKIVSGPVAGYTVLIPPPVVKAKKTIAPPPAAAATSTPVSTATSTPAVVYPTVRYVESGTGYVDDVDAKGGNETKVSGTVIARTAQALFGGSGSDIVFRYADVDNVTIETYLGHLVPGTSTGTPGTVTGQYLVPNISEVIASPDRKSFMFLVPDSNGDGGSVAETINTSGAAEKQAFTSPYEEWMLDWSALGTVLTTKAASTVPGYAYALSAGGVMTRLIGSVNGLTTKMSPDGKTMLYSVSTAAGLALHILNIKSGSDVNTGLSTLPEKCMYTPDSSTVYCGATATLGSGAYPDIWYQGLAHFNDAIWSINPSTGTTMQLDDGEGNFIDMTNLQLDSTGRFLFFTDKTDGSLWSFDLAPSTN